MDNNKRLNPSYYKGLTTAQVSEQQQKGLSNTPPKPITKTNGQIITDNVCTLFNLFNFSIAITLAFVGAYSNLFFIVIIIVNISIGIFQEIRAKNTIEKLSLISAPKVTVMRNGLPKIIMTEELVQDDIIIVDTGTQICADAIVVHGIAEVNESLLTGESDVVVKQQNDMLLSGSFVAGGKCYAKVEHIGDDNYAIKIALEAKKHKKVNSELVASMRKVTKITSFLIIPLGIMLFSQAYFLRLGTVNVAVVQTAAALLGMLPKGLMLLISITLATGVIKLSKKQVLVQELFTLESLAHVDVLCLDKTGTITEGVMSVQSVSVFEDVSMPISFEILMGSFLANADDNNATFIALKNYFVQNDELKPVRKIPFSSDRKYSAMTFNGIGTFVIGAPERISSVYNKEVAHGQSQGARVLFAAFTRQEIREPGDLPDLAPIAIITINDVIRKNAKQTLDFFQAQGVDLKIISGDNPVTVSYIAKQSGLKTADKYIDMSTVKTEDEFIKAAKEYSVFGRVSPQQKKQLVIAFKSKGHTVAMTGDGVNDVLALREADCGIAMAAGSDAAKQVSGIVLLDSNFSSLPDVLSEGRRSVNNVTRVAGVFFVKTIYSVILSILCMIANIPYPFIPIQITLIDLAIEGYPSFFISFEADNRKVTGTFLKTVFKKALPYALTVIVGILVVGVMGNRLSLDLQAITSIQYCLIAFISMTVVYDACDPFNMLRIFLCTTMTVGFYVAVFLFKRLLHVTMPTGSGLILLLVTALVCFIITKIIGIVVDKVLA